MGTNKGATVKAIEKLLCIPIFRNKDRLQQKRDSVANMVSQLSAEKLNLAADLDKSSILMRSMVNKADLKAE